MNRASIALQARQLHASLGKQKVLLGIDLDIYAGRWTAIVGPTGAGKSTLLKVLAGLLPAQGEVHLWGQPLSAHKPRDRAKTLSWLGQNESSTDDLRVHDVVMLGRLPHQDWLASANHVDQQAVETALKATQTWVWRDRSMGHLSAGERQRVLMARAMAVKAPVMLMDEPLTHLDPPHQVDWLEQMRCLTAQKTTVVSVLHEIGMALHADDLVVMQAGRVVHQGERHDAMTHRALEAVFENRIAIEPLNGQWMAVPKLPASG